MKLSAPLSIAPSILSADFTRLGDEIQAVTRAGAHLIHVDVMDGHFVPNITLGPDIVAAIRRSTHLPLDVHLMIENPERYISAFLEAGSTIITVHAEACNHLHRVIQQIRESGVKVGVSLNPATSLSVLDHILDDIDLILIMTVNPGFGGQKPIRAAIDKVAQIKAHLAKAELKDPPVVEVDGGVKVDNIQDFAAADVFGAGSGICHGPEQVERLKKSAMSVEELAASYGRVIDAMNRKLLEARGLKTPQSN